MGRKGTKKIWNSILAILSDIEMPGTMTGVDLAWVVNSKWPRTGLVLVSRDTVERSAFPER